MVHMQTVNMSLCFPFKGFNDAHGLPSLSNELHSFSKQIPNPLHGVWWPGFGLGVFWLMFARREAPEFAAHGVSNTM